ncbi:MAG: nucleotidyltransferase domain-containing protein [Candidatus Woesearchaeota archaeon]
MKTENKFDTAMNNIYLSYEQFKEIVAVYLYGSVARGDFSLRHSDLDLFIILNQQKPHKKTTEQINSLITAIGFENGVNVQIEFQGLKVNEEDKSLIRKVMEEGRLVFSSGFIVFDKYQIGLKPYLFYKYKIPNMKYRARFSQILHGYKSSYYKKEEKITKQYKGIIDNIGLIEVGKGAILVSKDKEIYLLKLFKEFDIDFSMVRMVYLE